MDLKKIVSLLEKLAKKNRLGSPPDEIRGRGRGRRGGRPGRGLGPPAGLGPARSPRTGPRAQAGQCIGLNPEEEKELEKLTKKKRLGSPPDSIKSQGRGRRGGKPGRGLGPPAGLGPARSPRTGPRAQAGQCTGLNPDLDEMTVSGKWKQISEEEWSFDAGKGWMITVVKNGKKYTWEVDGPGHTSKGRTGSYKQAQTMGIKQYRQVKEETELDEAIVNDDYGIIARIQRRNRMRALNLLRGKGLEKDDGLSESLEEGRQKRFIKKIMDMSDEQRKNIGPKERIEFKRKQYKPYVDKVVQKVMRIIDMESKSMKDMIAWDILTGKIEPSLYVNQGLLERVIMRLEELV